MRQYTAIAFIIAFCALVSTYDYMLHHLTICMDCQHVVLEQSDAILQGTASYPFVYRILTPNILKILGGSILSVVIFHLMMRGILLGLLYMWVDHWGGNALASVGLMTVVLSIMSYTWYESPYSLTEGVILLTGWLLLVSNRLTHIHYVSFAFLIILGMLNRETTGVVLFLSWLVLYGKRYHWTMIYLMLTVGVYLFLRLTIHVPASFGLTEVLSWNLTPWRLKGAIGYNGVLVPLWFAVLLFARSIPLKYKRLLLISIPYAGLFLSFGVWQEIRLLLPLVLLLMPLIGQSMRPKRQLIYW